VRPKLSGCVFLVHHTRVLPCMQEPVLCMLIIRQLMLQQLCLSAYQTSLNEAEPLCGFCDPLFACGCCPLLLLHSDCRQDGHCMTATD
jgi:hypothetical protein